MRTFSSPGVPAADEQGMALLATCFVLFLAPQEPSPTATPATATSTPTAEQDAASRLAELEKAGPKADAQALVELANGDVVGVSARAAWVLGVDANKFPTATLRAVAEASPHAEARAQVMQALERRRDPASTATAIQGLLDADRRVRTFAAQLLGKLRVQAGVEPLLALIDSSRKQPPKGPVTDLQAALLALHDLEATPHLLRVAMALHDGKVEGVGEALAYCCQDLAPKMPTNEQITFLVAMLDHRETLVRRYAIGRLGELGEPTTAAALEAHLTKESKELRPLVELALAQVRKDKTPPPPPDEMSRAKGNLSALWNQGSTWWWNLGVTMKALTAAGPIVAVVLAMSLFRWLRRRSDDKAAAAATVAMVQPSAEFVAQEAAEAEELAAEAEQAAAEDYPADENAAELEHDVASHR